jgi:heme/copper-type cytochrome/quinol oxidase subunit 2
MRRSTTNRSTLSEATGTVWIRGLAFLTALVALLLLPARASASLLSPEAEDKLADILAVVVIFLVPVIGIVVFWVVHVMPEKIAHQRHHPQFEAIRTLCLLSLLFGGLLWPLAWLWAYSKPVVYKMAYGTDKSPEYYKEHGLPDPHDDNGHTPGDDEPEPVA